MQGRGRLEERVKAHVLICMLACCLTWHLRKAWAPLTFTDEDPPACCPALKIPILAAFTMPMKNRAFRVSS